MISIIKTENRQGFHMTFANGWTISVQTGLGLCHDGDRQKLAPAPNAEIAVWHRDSPMIQWANNNDTIQGWVSPDRISRVMSYLANLRDDPSAWGEGSTHIWLSINGKKESAP